MTSERQSLLKWIDEARSSGARLTSACDIAGISSKTYRRWRRNACIGDRRQQTHLSPSHKLTPEEVEIILKTCNEPEYANLPPSQIVPKLADKGIYIASESSFYRVLREQCFMKPLVLHSDNGSPMKSSTLLAKLYELKITPSRGRPRVSNDNAYSESLFKTMKYKPNWPVSGFNSIEEARQWVNQFFQWYNESHCHSGIQFVTPSQRHKGMDKQLLENRRRVYEKARCRTPSRWSRNTRKWQYQEAVTLNPVRDIDQELKAA